jgi:hypothetical protein
MQSNRSDTKTTGVKKEENKERPKPEIRLSDLPGMVAAVVLIFVVGVSIFAYRYVNEHSAWIIFATTATFSFLGLLVIIAQAVIYAQQWEVMRRQQEMAAISQRAYIGIQDGKFVSPLASGEPPCLRMIFINGGNTPAWHFRSHYRMILDSAPLGELTKKFPVEYKRRQSGAFVPAGQIKRVETYFQFSVNEHQLAAIIRKSHTLYVFVEVEFRDFLGNWQHDSYRIAYNPDTKDLQDADVDIETEAE